MKNPERVAELIAELKSLAENQFESHRIEVLERDLESPPAVEVIDDTHQKFDGVTYTKAPSNSHYYSHDGIQRGVYSYYYGEIPTDHQIHHRDFNPANNEIANLQSISHAEHSLLHKPKGTPFPSILPRKFNCKFCGKQFTATNPTNKCFCSKECNRAYQNERAISKNCEQCGAPFLATRNNSQQRFCSKSCKAKWQHHQKESPLDKICANCGSLFHAHKRNQVCCSHTCANHYRHLKLVVPSPPDQTLEK